MRLFFAALLAAAFALPAAADEFCEELWFARNQIFDRAGYCFSSNLGQSVFGNAGCVTQEARLSAALQRDVAAIQGLERQFGCNVDSSRRTLNIPALNQRLALVDTPVPSEYASACYGQQGGPITLYAGRSESLPVTGQIAAGGDLVWTFDGAGGWAFVIAQEGRSSGLGWYRDQGQGRACLQSAG